MTHSKSTPTPSTSTPTSTATLAATSATDAPPTPSTLGHAPSVPANWTKLSKDEVARLPRLTRQQASEANAVAAEIQASATFTRDFGPAAPAEALVIAALQGTGALTLEGPRALAWSQYVGDMRLVQGETTVAIMDKVAAVVRPALAANPELGQTYPLLVQFVSLRSQEATRRAAKRTPKPKAQPASASSPAAAGEASAAAPPTAPAAKPAGS